MVGEVEWKFGESLCSLSSETSKDTKVRRRSIVRGGGVQADEGKN